MILRDLPPIDQIVQKVATMSPNWQHSSSAVPYISTHTISPGPLAEHLKVQRDNMATMVRELDYLRNELWRAASDVRRMESQLAETLDVLKFIQQLNPDLMEAYRNYRSVSDKVNQHVPADCEADCARSV